jgi:hypothetical protein
MQDRLDHDRQESREYVITSETKLVRFALAVWFCIALAVGLSGAFESASAPVIALTVWTLTAAILLGCWKVPPLYRWAMNVRVSRLIALHLTRFIGIYFLILCQRGELSCVFAKPAGIGDIMIAAGASILFGVERSLFFRLGWRNAVMVWNILGLLDILFVVVSALQIGLNDWQGMAPLRTLPLGLLPTFLVPLIIASHIVIFVRLGKRRDELVSSH